MIGRLVGGGFAAARDMLARALVRVGVTPNALSLVGVLFTAAAGVCYAMAAGRGFAWTLAPGGPNAYVLVAAGWLILASACDMLDGAVARIGGKATRFGAFLDSTVDRFSDFSIYAGIAVGYCLAQPANVTFVFLSMLAFFNSFMISYTRARAEDLIDRCRVGFWQRGERSAAVLIGSLACNIPAIVVQQGVLTLGTVWRRIRFAKAAIEGRQPVEDVRQGRWWQKAQLWQWPRMTVPYDLAVLANIAWLIFARIPAVDVVRVWLID